MSLYALPATGKESWKVIQDPRKNLDSVQNLINFSLPVYRKYKNDNKNIVEVIVINLLYE